MERRPSGLAETTLDIRAKSLGDTVEDQERADAGVNPDHLNPAML